MIKKEQFLQIIDNTPLVSIDLILEDSQERVLLGKRTNQPAQDFWFVPGGRIRKNETLDEAIHRISATELGITLHRKDATLLGAYDHIYRDNFAGTEDINTHYVALGHKFIIDEKIELNFDQQHSQIQWWNKEVLLADPHVHQNTKAYFLA